MRPALQPRPDELSELRQRVDALARELDAVRLRLDGLTAERAAERPLALALAADASAVDESSGGSDLLPLLGRAFLALGGAFLVRALTEAGALRPAVGVACGFAYALALVVWAVRGARRGRRRPALTDGVAAALVVFPLLWEGVRRFGVLDGERSAAALGVAAHALLAAAALSSLPALAWVAALGAVGTALLLLPATHALAPLTLAILLLAFTTRALARARGWPGLGWPALAGGAVLVGAGVLVTTRTAGVPAAFGALSSAHVLTLALGLPAATVLASAVPRRDRLEMPVSGVVQVAVAVAVGYAGALRVASAGGRWEGPLALLGLAGAGLALVWGEGRRPRQPVHADASALVALSVALYASAQLLGPAGRVIAWSAAGAALCATVRSVVLGWTGAALLALAALQAGVVSGVARGLGGAAPRDMAGLALAAAVLASALAARSAPAAKGAAALRDALAVLALAPLALLALAAASSAAGGDLARGATAATAVLAATACALAALVRAGRPFGPRWVAYAALALGGLKLIVSDLRQGRPATLFVAFALYGAALIFTSRLMRRPAPAPPA